MNWIDYYVGHCWYSGWQSIRGAFRNWCDLMTDNHEGYALLDEDDDAEECRLWFWTSLGEDNVYSKDFLEYLYELSEQVRRGEVETIPWNPETLEDFLAELESEDK